MPWDCDAPHYNFPVNPADPIAEPRRVFGNKFSNGELLGSCKVGQLLPAGYKQQASNGKILREAYIGAGKLLPAEFDPNEVYLHSDDMERTIDSGQMMFNSLYPPTGKSPAESAEVIKWHTRDHSAAILDPDWEGCPRLTEIYKATQSCAAMKRFNFSEEVIKLRKSWEWVLEQRGAGPNAREVKKMNYNEAMRLADALVNGQTDAGQSAASLDLRRPVLAQSEFPFTMHKLMDCLFTARCSQRRIPWGVTEALFNRTVRYKERLEQILLRYTRPLYTSLLSAATC
jgi:hypothetical protein